MDLLDRVLEAGRDLLARVDAALITGGAPSDHPVWPLARTVGALPGQAAEALAAVRPEPLLGCAARLRSLAQRYSHQRAILLVVAESGAWEGAGSQAFAGQVRAFAGHLGSVDDDSLVGRLTASASFLEDAAAWMGEARRMLAAALATALVSAEAVRLYTGADETRAAAAIAARMLDTVAQAQVAGDAMRERWVGRLDEVAYRPPTGVPAARPDGTTRVTL